jgi:hypothetical protein
VGSAAYLRQWEVHICASGEEFDYPLSLEVYQEMSRIMKAQLPENVKVKTITTDSVMQRNILNAAQKIVRDIEKRKKRIKKVVIPEVLIKSLDSANEDFGFVILESGFARTYNNYINHLIYNRDPSLLLGMGTVEYTPYKEGSMLIGFIIDKKNRNLAYYKKIFWQQRDPTEKIVIKAQLHDLMMSYFQHAK